MFRGAIIIIYYCINKVKFYSDFLHFMNLLNVTKSQVTKYTLLYAHIVIRNL